MDSMEIKKELTMTKVVEMVYTYNEIGAFAVLWFISDIGLKSPLT